MYDETQPNVGLYIPCVHDFGHFGQIMKLMSTFICANFYRHLRNQLVHAGDFWGEEISPQNGPGNSAGNRKMLAPGNISNLPKTLRSVHMTWCLSFFFWQKWEPRSLEKFPQQLILCYPPKKMCLCQKNKKNTTKMFFRKFTFSGAMLVSGRANSMDLGWRVLLSGYN